MTPTDNTTHAEQHRRNLEIEAMRSLGSVIHSHPPQDLSAIATRLRAAIDALLGTPKEPT